MNRPIFAIGAAFYLEPTSSLDIFILFDESGENRLTPLRPIYRYLATHGAEVKGAGEPALENAYFEQCPKCAALVIAKSLGSRRS